MELKKEVIELLGKANLSESRLKMLKSEFSKSISADYKDKIESCFRKFAKDKIMNCEIDFIKDLNPKTVTEIVEFSGLDIKPQRAGVILSGMGFNSSKNEFNRVIYSFRK